MATSAQRTIRDRLVATSAPSGRLQPSGIYGLPPAAQRLLRHSIAPDTDHDAVVRLQMEGEIRLKRWMSFRAEQLISGAVGFAWLATVGSFPIVVRGGDTFIDGTASLDFRLWGLIPVARSHGPDTTRSAAGRLAAETLTWVPQALLPQSGATWTAVDEDHATVSLDVGGDSFDVTATVDPAGVLTEVSMLRWGNPDGGEFDLHPFGGTFDAHHSYRGLTVPTSGRIGWWWGTDRWPEGEFFRFRLTGYDVVA